VDDLERKLGKGVGGVAQVVSDHVRVYRHGSQRGGLVDRNRLDAGRLSALEQWEDERGVVHPPRADRVDLVGVELQADGVGDVLELAIELLETDLQTLGRVEADVGQEAVGVLRRGLERLLVTSLAVLVVRVEPQGVVCRQVDVGLEEHRLGERLHRPVAVEHLPGDGHARGVPVGVHRVQRVEEPARVDVRLLVGGIHVVRVRNRVDHEDVVDHAFPRWRWSAVTLLAADRRIFGPDQGTVGASSCLSDEVTRAALGRPSTRRAARA
jgi:hypothetical protein